MLEIAEVAHYEDLFAFRLCLIPTQDKVEPADSQLQRRASSPRSTQKAADAMARKCLPKADAFKEKNTLKQPKSYGLEEGSREVPSAVEIALSASMSGWLACWLTKIDGDHVAVNTGEGGRVPSFPTYVCVYIYVSVYLLSHLFCSCLCDLRQQAVEMWPFPGMRNASRKVRLHILMNIWRPWSHATWFATN